MLGIHHPTKFVIEPKNIAKAIENKITVVAAAGDYGDKDILFPSNVSGVIGVEAINNKNMLWEYSNQASNSVMAFPGEQIIAITYRNNENTVDSTNGTSQASAIASAYIALIKDYAGKQKVELDNEQLIRILYDLNTKDGQDINYKYPFKKISEIK